MVFQENVLKGFGSMDKGTEYRHMNTPPPPPPQKKKHIKVVALC